jgi:hypothetical protein
MLTPRMQLRQLMGKIQRELILRVAEVDNITHPLLSEMTGTTAAVDTAEDDSAATAVVDLTTVDTMAVVDSRIAAGSPSAGDAKILAGAEDAGGRDPGSNKRRTRHLRMGG